MSNILSVATWRPHDGKTQEFVAGVGVAKKIHERLGGRVRVLTTQFGGSPLTLVYGIDHDSWAAFGTFGEKLASDSEWLALTAQAQANPLAELVSHSVSFEVAV
jgi:hypothetical protein